MKVSIAIATYNGEKYIYEQLDSILSQTLLPDEIVISDDCSTDSTFSILNTFKNKSKIPVTLLVNNHKLGYTQNFNNALLNTTGDIVFLCDQDDVWFVKKIEEVIKIAKVENKWLIMHNKEITDSDLISTGTTAFEKYSLMGKSLESFVSGSVMAVKRELLNICLPIPNDFVGHDNWIAYHAQVFNQITLLPLTLMYYRRHKFATMNSTKNVIITNLISKIKDRINFINMLQINNILFLKSIENIILNNITYSMTNNFCISKFINQNNIFNTRMLKKSAFKNKIRILFKLYNNDLYKGAFGKIVLIYDLYFYK